MTGHKSGKINQTFNILIYVALLIIKILALET